MKTLLRKITFIFFAMLSTHTTFVIAQDSSEFKISGYVDTYFAYDNDDNGSSLRQFSVIAPIRDQIRINLAQITGKYTADRIRGTATFQFGDIPNYNWPQSPNQYLQYIQEANAGFRPGKNLWVDFGYFLTHIGAEGVIPINDYLSTFALQSFYEPIYQSGVRVTYDFSKQVYGSLYLLNGYNVLADNNKNLSGGMQLGVKPNSKMEIIYNNIFGNEQPTGSPGKTRFFNNLVFKLSAAKQLDILFGGDFCVQAKSNLTDTANSASMYAVLLALRYNVISKLYLIARGEYYQDDDGILSGTYVNGNGHTIGLKGSGFTFGIEGRPLSNSYLRLESRYLITGNDLLIFNTARAPKDTRFELVFTTGIIF